MACEEELNRILLRVGEDLLSDDVKNILFLLGDDIAMSEKDRISTGVDLMSVLKDRNILGRNNLERLKTFLSEIRRKDLKDRLETYEQKVRNINTARANANLTCVPNFVETKQCKEVETSMQGNKLVILRGISGSGKTQLTLKCAKRYLEKTGSNVWKLTCQDENDLIQSLSEILEFFQMKFECQTVEKNKYIMEMVSVISNKVASEEWRAQSFLFIFDDICKACYTAVAGIFCEMREAPNVKIIASTESSTFYQQFILEKNEVFVSVMGVSKDDVMNFFLNSEHFKGKDDDLNHLAKYLGYLPYALVLARSFMESTGMNVKEYLKRLNDPKFLQSMEIPLDMQRYNKGLVGAQILTLEKVEKSISELGKSLLHLMPFLDFENVPYTLLQELANDLDDGLEIRKLIRELKSYSIGKITTSEEETIISLHAVTKMVILHRLSQEERVSIIQKLLWFFSCHLRIDCRLRSSLASNLILQNHAECVIIEAERNAFDLNKKGMRFLLCIIQTAIGVCLRVSGSQHLLADEYLTKAKTQMFGLIEESPEKFKLRLDDKDTMETTTRSTGPGFILMKLRRTFSSSERTEDTSFEKSEQESTNFSKVQRLYTKLEDATKDLPLQFITDFVLKLNRSEMDMKHLQTVARMGSMDTNKLCLTIALYEKLKSAKAAMSIEQIRDIFAVELMIIILYNNGRHYYQWKLGEKSSDEFCCNELLTAAMLGKLLKRNFPDFVSVQYLITHRNGMFYHDETGKRYTQDKELVLAKNDLEETICRLERMSDPKLQYFEFGILKVSEHHRLHQEGMCLELMLQCYIQLYCLCNNKEEEREHQYTRAKICAEKLHTLTREMPTWRAVPGFHVQLARFYKLKQNQTLLGEAVKHFKIADELETENNVKGLSHFQLQARFGLVECYKLLGDHDSLAEAQGICQCLVTRLHETNLYGIQGKARKYLEEIQQLMESSVSGT